jgi:hypothetical protein
MKIISSIVEFIENATSKLSNKQKLEVYLYIRDYLNTKIALWLG